MATKQAKATLNVLKNSTIEINCRARIKSAQEQALVDSIVNAVRETDTHIGRIRFDRNPKSYGSTGTRFVKQSYSVKDNTYELYVNLAKVSNRAGDYQFDNETKLLDTIRKYVDRGNCLKFITKINKKYKLEETAL
jgi:predicted transcriptional regulator